MKHLFLLCISLLLSISVYGQKDVYEARLKEYKSKKEKITPNSQVVSDKYAKSRLGLLFVGLYQYGLLSLNLNDVKSITLKSSDGNTTTAYLDSKGNPTKIIFSDNFFFQFLYEEGLLRTKGHRTLFADEVTSYLYDDNEIFTKIEEPLDKLSNTYYVYDSAQFKDKYLNYTHIYLSTDEITESSALKKGNQIVLTRKGKNSEENFVFTLSNTKNYLPISYYDYNGNKGVVEEKSPILWIETLGERITEYHWDNNQRISKIVVTEGKEKTVYTYEYEMY